MRDIFLHLEELKKERNAVILAHYYQDPDINGFIIATESGVIHQMKKHSPRGKNFFCLQMMAVHAMNGLICN